VGPIESAAARISVMGICNKMAGVLAPVVLGVVLLGDADTLQTEIDALQGDALTARLDDVASRVVRPYAVMGVVLVALGLLVRWSPLPELDPEVEAPAGHSDGRSILSFPNLVLGVIALFLYVGVEVMAGDTIGLYGQSQGMSLEDAKGLTSYTLICMVVGYVVGIITIPRFLSQSKALAGSAILGIVFTLGAILLHGKASVMCIALLGLANALVWPAIWPLAIEGLGRHTRIGSALLIMAIAGGAVLPLIYGHLGQVAAIGFQKAYWMMVPCYLFILWYGAKGARIQRW
jgi:MFS transporter, FHS family, L-fucose permease